MGKSKSPGKWIRTVLFGKKPSRSSGPKGKEKAANEREVLVTAQAPEANLGSDLPAVSQLTPSNINKNEGQSNKENRQASNSPNQREISLPRNEFGESTQLDAPNAAERSKQEHAATKAQAAFRGYLARRAFRALKGIIRLQALIRGHLVRRQAVSTMHCMLGIVKLQALVRGKTIRQTGLGLEMHRQCLSEKTLKSKLVDAVGVHPFARIDKLSVNAFGRKLFASSAGPPMPLHLKYDDGNPNSVMSWLERWSSSQFWKPAPQPKIIIDSKPQKKQGASQKVEKRSNPRVPAANVDNISIKSSSEIEKPKRSLRKVPSHPVEPLLQESPQNEFEKVKRNLRKVHNPVVENSVQVQTEFENNEQSQSLMKVLSASDQHVLEQTRKDSDEKVLSASDQNILEPIKNDSTEKMKDATLEATPEPYEDQVAIDLLCDTQTVTELNPTENGGKRENAPLTDPTSSQDLMKFESQKSSRKISTPAKQERVDNSFQGSPTLPSYMQVTESAKAKLRGQGLSRFVQDGTDGKVLPRRHSLPSLAGSKISPSPRTQKPAQASAKLGNGSEKSLSASRDGNGKVVQAGWRR